MRRFTSLQQTVYNKGIVVGTRMQCGCCGKQEMLHPSVSPAQAGWNNGLCPACSADPCRRSVLVHSKPPVPHVKENTMDCVISVIKDVRMSLNPVEATLIVGVRDVACIIEDTLFTQRIEDTLEGAKALICKRVEDSYGPYARCITLAYSCQPV